MSHLATTDRLFFDRAGLDPDRLQRLTDGALAGADDGELFLEYLQSESLVFDDGRLRNASYDTTQGFGLRAVAGEASGYAHASALDEAAIARAAETVQAVTAGYSGQLAENPPGTNRLLYADGNPVEAMEFAAKVKLLEDIDAYARAKDPRVVQVSASISGEWQAVQIIRAGGHRVADVRPLIRLNVAVTVEKDGRREAGSHGAGGRFDLAVLVATEKWQAQVDEALRQALVNLEAVPAPAGEQTVVLGANLKCVTVDHRGRRCHGWNRGASGPCRVDEINRCGAQIDRRGASVVVRRPFLAESTIRPGGRRSGIASTSKIRFHGGGAGSYNGFTN